MDEDEDLLTGAADTREEILRLTALGWTAPRVAQALEITVDAVRYAIRKQKQDAK